MELIHIDAQLPYTTYRLHGSRSKDALANCRRRHDGNLTLVLAKKPDKSV